MLAEERWSIRSLHSDWLASSLRLAVSNASRESDFHVSSLFLLRRIVSRAAVLPVALAVDAGQLMLLWHVLQHIEDGESSAIRDLIDPA